MSSRLAVLASILASSTFAQNVPPAGLSSIRIAVPIAIDDFSNLAEPAKVGLVPREDLERDAEGAIVALSPAIEAQIREEIAQALRHDGYAARIQVIERAEDSGARRFHARVGTTAAENVVRLGARAEDSAAFEAIGVESADRALVPLQPYSPPGASR